MKTNSKPTERRAYSMAEFAAMLGKTPSWAHKLHYEGKLKVIEGLGRKLVPLSEVRRLLGE